VKRFFVCVFLFNACLGVFAQAPLKVDSLREYVGLISVSDHPDLIAFVEKIKADLKNENTESAERAKKTVPKEPPYERPVGSGFLFKADNGNTYVLTNWHVIAFSWDYSITFEKNLNEKTVYSNLTLLAADEELDLALLAFAPGNSPDREGLPLLERKIQEGEDVYSAGFPALGRNPIWQLGRGQISNSQVMLYKYDDDDEDIMEGPFIQHTSQVDPGNSGGPLLIADASSPKGFFIAGINARSARRRQAANYSIPADTVRVFLEQVFNPSAFDAETERKKLDERLRIFTKDLKTNRYTIYNWITYQCFLDNVEYAYYWAAAKNSWYHRNFANQPMDSLMNTFNTLVKETIPHSSLKKKNEVSITSVEEDKNAYNVILRIHKQELASRWETEHGNWRIVSIGQINGNTARIAKAEKLYNNQKNVRDGYSYEDNYTVEGGYAYVLDRGGAVYGALGITLAGLRCVFADADYWQLEIFGRGHSKPLRMGVFAMDMNLGLGLGIKKIPKADGNDWGIRFGVSPTVGTELTSSVIPGLYIGAAYQYNFYYQKNNDKNNTHHLFLVFAGYRFNEE